MADAAGASQGSKQPDATPSSNNNRSNDKQRAHGGCRNNHQGNSFVPPPAKFKGECEAIKDFIFDLTNQGAPVQFQEAVEGIARYIGKTYDHGADIRMALELSLIHI